MAMEEGGLRPPRVAELVADRLRTRILSGDLADGTLLPKEEDLRAEYPVAKVSLREAMRILETEGLVTVRRGNVGGAVVHAPSPATAAYNLGLVLTARQVGVADVARALREVEPGCAALCAERRDRARAVVAPLRRVHKEGLRSVKDLIAVIDLSRQFHESLVALCGNETLIVVAGALEALWSSHEKGWAQHWAEPGDVPLERRRDALDEHAHIVDLIAAGDAAAAREAAAAHLANAQVWPGTDGAIDLSALRGR